MPAMRDNRLRKLVADDQFQCTHTLRLSDDFSADLPQRCGDRKPRHAKGGRRPHWQADATRRSPSPRATPRRSGNRACSARRCSRYRTRATPSHIPLRPSIPSQRFTQQQLDQSRGRVPHCFEDRQLADPLAEESVLQTTRRMDATTIGPTSRTMEGISPNILVNWAMKDSSSSVMVGSGELANAASMAERTAGIDSGEVARTQKIFTELL